MVAKFGVICYIAVELEQSLDFVVDSTESGTQDP